MAKLELKAEPGQPLITMTRVFNAPREVVFKAHTDPKLVKQWWAGKYQMEIDTMDAKPGGSWRFISKDEDGNEFNFHGVYHEVTSPERIINTFEFEGLPEPGHVILETTKFEAQGSKTKLINISAFQSVEDRDGMLKSGMETGASESWDALAKLVEKK